MGFRSVSRRSVSLAAAVALCLVLAACSGIGLTAKRTQGYDISDDALAQIRPGQSQALVNLVLGSPQTTNSFGDETAYYYIQTKVESTSFGLNMVQDRKVLAIYFDKNKKVADKAVYTLKDGKVFAMETRRTPSYGLDRTFVESILASF